MPAGPAGAGVLGSPAELTGEVVRLSDVWGRDADRFEECLHAAGSWDERFAIVTSSPAARTPSRRRLVRFDHAAHLLVAGHPAAGVAVESGYADQSHRHREMREFAGLTPAAVAVAPWLTIGDVAWPATRVPRRGAGR